MFVLSLLLGALGKGFIEGEFHKVWLQNTLIIVIKLADVLVSTTCTTSFGTVFTDLAVDPQLAHITGLEHLHFSS